MTPRAQRTRRTGAAVLVLLIFFGAVPFAFAGETEITVSLDRPDPFVPTIGEVVVEAVVVAD